MPIACRLLALIFVSFPIPARPEGCTQRSKRQYPESPFVACLAAADAYPNHSFGIHKSSKILKFTPGAGEQMLFSDQRDFGGTIRKIERELDSNAVRAQGLEHIDVQSLMVVPTAC